MGGATWRVTSRASAAAGVAAAVGVAAVAVQVGYAPLIVAVLECAGGPSSWLASSGGVSHAGGGPCAPSELASSDGLPFAAAFLAVTDLDEASRCGDGCWFAKLKAGWLRQGERGGEAHPGAEPPVSDHASGRQCPEVALEFRVVPMACEWEVRSDQGDAKGRGMELSELLWWKGALLTVDDRTGTVFEVPEPDCSEFSSSEGGGGGGRGSAWLNSACCEAQNQRDPLMLRPRWTVRPSEEEEEPQNPLRDTRRGRRQGTVPKFEWMAVKGDDLHVGGIGKEWTDERGHVVHRDSMLVSRLDAATGAWHHERWHQRYEHLRRSTGFTYPGYLWLEAVAWSEVLGEWVYLPRTASTEPYDAALDLQRGADFFIRSRGGRRHETELEALHIFEKKAAGGKPDTAGALLRPFVHFARSVHAALMDAWRTLNERRSPVVLVPLVHKNEDRAASQGGDGRLTPPPPPRNALGFASFKFVQGTGDTLMAALMTEERGPGDARTYVTVVALDGQVVLEPTYFASAKFEGLEWLDVDQE